MQHSTRTQLTGVNPYAGTVFLDTASAFVKVFLHLLAEATDWMVLHRPVEPAALIRHVEKNQKTESEVLFRKALPEILNLRNTWEKMCTD
jgi:hypothetical protein